MLVKCAARSRRRGEDIFESESTKDGVDMMMSEAKSVATTTKIHVDREDPSQKPKAYMTDDEWAAVKMSWRSVKERR